MKEIVITGFTILKSVGAGGTNDPDDIDTIQILLNGISPGQGGAFPPLAVLDAADNINRAELARMIEAIRTFQELHFQFDDGRVDPEMRTIRKLRELFRKKPSPLPGDVLFIQAVQPFDGFDGAAAPPWALVAMPRAKQLRVENLLPTDTLEVPEGAPYMVDRAGEIISLRGTNNGSSTLQITRAGEAMVDLRVEVVTARSFSLCFLYVKGPGPNEGTSRQLGDAAGMLAGVNRVYGGQAGVTFTFGGEAEISAINGKAVDFRQRTFLIADSAPAGGRDQVFTWADLTAEAATRASADCHAFFVKDVEHFPKSAKCTNCIGGTTMIGTGPAIIEDSASNTNRFVLLAHELGHFLGYPAEHKSPPDSLMTPRIGAGMNQLKVFEEDFRKMTKVAR
jgi:hypothetical protein